MKKTVSIGLIFVLALTALVGCSSASGAMVYGKDDTTIIVNAGQSFMIQLESNPTTGYSWNAAVGDDSIVELTDSEYKADSVGTDVVGSGGMEILTFKALKTGATTITLTYERSWETGNAAETIVYHVTVK